MLRVGSVPSRARLLSQGSGDKRQAGLHVTKAAWHQSVVRRMQRFKHRLHCAARIPSLHLPLLLDHHCRLRKWWPTVRLAILLPGRPELHPAHRFSLCLFRCQPRVHHLSTRPPFSCAVSTTALELLLRSRVTTLSDADRCRDRSGRSTCVHFGYINTPLPHLIPA